MCTTITKDIASHPRNPKFALLPIQLSSLSMTNKACALAHVCVALEDVFLVARAQQRTAHVHANPRQQ